MYDALQPLRRAAGDRWANVLRRVVPLNEYARWFDEQVGWICRMTTIAALSAPVAKTMVPASNV